MAVICQSCQARNGDDESSCSLCGASLIAEVTATDPKGPGEATGAFENIIRGVVVGAKLTGRYLVKEMLGRGGAAMVFRATDESLHEDIALKVFPNLMRQDPGELERFKRELLVNRRISHPNVIRVHDFGTVGDDAYLTMELLGGGTLAERIEKKPLPIEEAVEIAIGISDGLNAAHEAGIVHRDVKPENVLFDGAGRPKLVDFGLARLLGASTHTQGFSGTPFYMSPEQANGDEITAQTDVYSLGVLLFELFTGQLPFFADSLVRIATLHLKEPPPRPSTLRAGLPASLEQLILACLAKAPAERPAGAGAVATALRKFLREGGAAQVRKLDDDPSFSAPRPRPRLPQSDRTQIKAPGDAPPRTSNADDPTLDKVVAPSRNRETVLARVSSAPKAVPPPDLPTPAPREQGSGPRPNPREQGSGPRPIPRERVSAPSELPMPLREPPPALGRRSPLLAIGGIVAVALLVVAGFAIPSGLFRRDDPPVTPDFMTPVPTMTEVAVLRPSPTPTPAPTRERTPTPRSSATAVAVAPTPPPADGEIKVTGIPWVSVFVGGRKKGEDVALHSLRLPPGPHTIRLENKALSYRGEIEVTVRSKQTCALKVNLEKPNATIVASPGC